MPVTWSTHQGKSYLFIDYRPCRSQEEMITLLEEAMRVAAEQSGPLLAVSNLENCGIGPEFMNKAKELGKELQVKQNSRHAILGISGLISMLFQSFLNTTGWKHTRLFDSEAKALEWLSS